LQRHLDDDDPDLPAHGSARNPFAILRRRVDNFQLHGLRTQPMRWPDSPRGKTTGQSPSVNLAPGHPAKILGTRHRPGFDRLHLHSSTNLCWSCWPTSDAPVQSHRTEVMVGSNYFQSDADSHTVRPLPILQSLAKLGGALRAVAQYDTAETGGADFGDNVDYRLRA
jgi:hypothetical protein